MDALKNLFDNLKEQLKTAWAEQQDSALFLSAKERYEGLPPIGQMALKIAGSLLVILLVLWWPLSNFFDSTDLSNQFTERRDSLKELLRIERDLANQPLVTTPPSPASMKNQFDGKIAAAGIKPNQVKDASEMPMQMVGGAEQRGFQYNLLHLTLRQTVDLSYELEHTDPNFKLGGLELIAEPQDPHFYDVGIRIVSFAPKVAELSAPGKGLFDAIKSRGGSSAGGGGDSIAPSTPSKPADKANNR